jgi:tetratricopeptide (TPR) repeat protein
MKNMIRIPALLLFIILCLCATAQSKKDKALQIGLHAIDIMDSGRIDESIKLLEAAEKLDPDRIDYPYEIAYAHYLKEDYKGAIKLLEKIADRKDASERLFQLLGNSYDIIGKSDIAFEKYDQGLKKFPNSGMLFLEKGNVYWGKKEYNKALGYYEKGIEVDPAFPSNYYRATRLYCNSDQEVWGMIYGEIFMNLERNSKRTAEISKLLFDTYKSQMKMTSDTSMSVDFCKNIITAADGDPKHFKMPFCLVYEPTIMLSAPFTKNMDIDYFDTVRTRFVGNYYKMDHNKTHPNILFEYQNKLRKAGHLEAYNHWILMKGDEDGFDKWQTANKDKWTNFVIWFKENPLKVDKENRFYSTQY